MLLQQLERRSLKKSGLNSKRATGNLRNNLPSFLYYNLFRHSKNIIVKLQCYMVFILKGCVDHSRPYSSAGYSQNTVALKFVSATQEIN